MKPTRRRDVIKAFGSMVAAPLVATGPLVSGVDAAVPANEVIDVAVIGVGVRGKYLIANLPPTFRVRALCDCSLDQIETAVKPSGKFKKILDRFAAKDGPRAETFQDYRVMLRTRKFDAVIIAAPDHHHALAAMLAMESGADVYIEKPLAVTIAEGRAIVDAAKRYRKVVQVGSQQRTMSVNRRACEFVRAGGLGKVSLIEERNYPGPMPYVPEAFGSHAIGRQAIPKSLDWELFCGPTPKRDYHEKLWIKDAFDFGYLQWRGWDLFEDYSGHLMTNWGAHSIDMIQYALGKDATGPSQIALNLDDVGPYSDDQWHEKTPPLGTLKDKRVDRLRFAPVSMTYSDGATIELRPGIRKTTFHGEKGKLFLSRNDYRTEPEHLLPSPSEEEKRAWDGDGHVARPHLENWAEAIRSRRQPNAPIEVGHRSATACHLANIARRLGQDLNWDPVTERFAQADANDLIERPRRTGFELPT